MTQVEAVLPLWNTGEYTYSDICDALAAFGMQISRGSVGRAIAEARKKGMFVLAISRRDLRARSKRGAARTINRIGMERKREIMAYARSCRRIQSGAPAQ